VTGYAELQVTSNFSFLRGASHPEELVARAAELGLAAVAITDRNSLAGVVRAHIAAKAAGVRLLVGARLDFTGGPSALCLPTDRAAYGRLSQLLTRGKRRAPKGECWLGHGDLDEFGDGQIVVALAPETPRLPDECFARALARLAERFAGSCFLAAQHLSRGDDARRLAALAGLADVVGVPLVASNDVHAHDPGRRALQDVLTCIREHCTLDDAGFRLFASAERHLKAPDEMARLFAAYPDAVARTVEIAGRIGFSLDELSYDYPAELAADGRTPQDELVRLTRAGVATRYPTGLPAKVAAQIEHELTLIGELGYAPYFLTVHDIVRFARSRGILCQGRGSAANSAVCYCLGITAVDPDRIDLLFERFVSAARGEPPDIDVDFEHERREEVIQYVYEKYGRERAGLAATVIRYRSKSAVREVGKAFGLSADVLGVLARTVWGRSGEGVQAQHLAERGLDAGDRRLTLVLEMSRELIGFPRHLSQHVGGFVITDGPLSALSPIANAAMDGRTTLEWDKDDLDALGILKIDLLGLGMLSCIRKCFALIEAHEGRALTLASVPAEDAEVYDMLCDADSIGVFQIESRAQMSMLPRFKPRCFYDLVIEVAIVRPGPIQGDMVHPYLRRRAGEETVEFPSVELEEVLGKTLGVPLFQEQAMRIAMVAAGFSAEEADGLRRAMATFRHTGRIGGFHDKFVGGMTTRGYDPEFAERCFKQIEGFGEYGFPESHAASFALLVYVSAWLKRHAPAAFACALLNSQPMGFYAPAQILRDAASHGVRLHPADVNHSEWDCTLEPVDEEPDCTGERGREESAADWGAGGPALRLGLRQIRGFREEDANRLVAAREADGAFAAPASLRARSGLAAAALDRLARADALGSMQLARRAGLWAVRGLGPAPAPLFAQNSEGAIEAPPEAPARLPTMGLGEAVMEDYASLRLSLKDHPLALLRNRLATERVAPCNRLAGLADGARVSVAGLVICRQRPDSASGVIFVTLEDETGVANIVVWQRVFERFRATVLGAPLLRATGRLQIEGRVIHLVAERLEDLSERLRALRPAGAGLAPVAERGVEASHFPARSFR
jgi:error-prone DNA polymerase